jgi:hypothetical protein
MALVEVALFPTRSEAEVAAAALRAYGIDANLYDDALGQAYRSPLSGRGFAVFAPAAVKEEAQALLKSMRDAPPAAEEE